MRSKAQPFGVIEYTKFKKRTDSITTLQRLTVMPGFEMLSIF